MNYSTKKKKEREVTVQKRRNKMSYSTKKMEER